MLRRLGSLAATAAAAVTMTVPLAGEAVAAPPSQSDERDCRVTAVCHPGQHLGWDHHRNIGG